MKSFEEAYSIMMDFALPVQSERTPLFQALGRTLQEDVFADVSMPPFDKSSMDGYACRRVDLNEPLTVVETIPAGHLPMRIVGPGECAKIMTGAKIPTGAEVVVMVEHTCIEDGRVVVTEKNKRSNICKYAEDVREGDLVLRKGTLIGPVEMAILASFGCAAPLVARRPIVGIIATGSELVEPEQKPGEVQIRNSNSAQLFAQVTSAGATALYFGIAPDDRAETEQVIRLAMTKCDVMILSGGVSVGDFDFVPSVLNDIGVRILFDKVAHKPGKAIVFGTADNCRIIGLPGNPASTFVVFELMMRPFLSKILGREYRHPKIRTRTASAFNRRDIRRMETIPVQITADGRAAPVSYHGSAHIHAFASADAMIQFPMGVATIEENQEVDLLLLTKGLLC